MIPLCSSLAPANSPTRQLTSSPSLSRHPHPLAPQPQPQPQPRASPSYRLGFKPRSRCPRDPLQHHVAGDGGALGRGRVHVRSGDVLLCLAPADHLQRRVRSQAEALLQEHRCHPHLRVHRNDHGTFVNTLPGGYVRPPPKKKGGGSPSCCHMLLVVRGGSRTDLVRACDRLAACSLGAMPDCCLHCCFRRASSRAGCCTRTAPTWMTSGLT